jgi:hypothetical protein
MGRPAFDDAVSPQPDLAAQDRLTPQRGSACTIAARPGSPLMLVAPLLALLALRRRAFRT